jgi:hypothetical protein
MAELVLPADFTTVQAGPRSYDVGLKPSVRGEPPHYELQHVVRRDDDVLVKVKAATAKALMGDDNKAFKAATAALKKACNSKQRRALATLAKGSDATPKPADCARLALTGTYPALRPHRAHATPRTRRSLCRASVSPLLLPPPPPSSFAFGLLPLRRCSVFSRRSVVVSQCVSLSQRTLGRGELLLFSLPTTATAETKAHYHHQIARTKRIQRPRRPRRCLRISLKRRTQSSRS